MRAPVRLYLASIAAVASVCAHAETYYVRNGGDDDADGRSHDSAWASLDKVNSFNFAAGDNVLFHEGGRWQGQLIVDWSGRADALAVIGAYRLVDGLPTRGYGTSRPVIDGTGSLPGEFDGLIRVGTDHVRLEHLHVTNSDGRGIQFQSTDSGEIVDCEIDNTYKSAIKFVDSQAPTIRANVISRAGSAEEDGEAWGGAIALVRTEDGVISRNLVSEVYGEGINVNEGSSRAVIEDNVIFGARAVGIYVDATPDVTVRRNLIAGTTDPDFWRTDSISGAGIALNNERYHYTSEGGTLRIGVQSRGAHIYGNLVAYTSSGIAFWGQLDGTSFDDTWVFNNTLVDNNTQIMLRDAPKPGGKLVNNILLSLSPGTRDVDTADLQGMSAKANYLSNGDPGGDLSDPMNRYDGLMLERMNGWRTIASLGGVDWQDFAVIEGSAAIGAGDDEPRLMSQSDNTFDVDFNGLVHNAPMDMGALRFSTIVVKTPKKPTGVHATP